MQSNTVLYPYPEVCRLLRDYEAPIPLYESDVKPIASDIFASITKQLEDLSACVDVKVVDIEIINQVTKRVTYSIKDLVAPSSWGEVAVRVFASKYLIKNHETSILQAISRGVAWVAMNGIRSGYLQHPLLKSRGCVATVDADKFIASLFNMIVEQRGIFNSPFWFNVGVDHPWGIAQTSGCQPYRAMVSTSGGFIPIGRIVKKNMIGIKVLDSDGETEVVAVKYNGKKKVYRVVLRSGAYTEMTMDHTVFVCPDRGRKGYWTLLKNVDVGMYMHHHIHRMMGTSCSLITKQMQRKIDEAALAGWLLTDGYVGQPGKASSLIVECESVDDDEFNYVERITQSVFPHSHWNTTEEETSDERLTYRRLRAYGETHRDFVNKWGLLYRKTHKRVPSRLFNADLNIVRGFLRSVFQADGYVSVRATNRLIGLGSVSKRFIEGIHLLLQRFGIFSRIGCKPDVRPNCHDSYTISIQNLSEVERFAEHIGFISTYKNDKLSSALVGNGRVIRDIQEEMITSIDFVREEDVYDIQTYSGSYLSNNVLIHNCFVTEVNDDMGSIMGNAVVNQVIALGGSGSGADLSNIRSRKEDIGGDSMANPTGPVGFQRYFDATLQATRSGGKTRRSAGLTSLKQHHPDIVEYVKFKAIEEAKGHWLKSMPNFDLSFASESQLSIFGSLAVQNINTVVRLTKEFWDAYFAEHANDQTFALYDRHGEPIGERLNARAFLELIAQCELLCGDPGVQFHDVVNAWNPFLEAGIECHSTNACSELQWINNSACNLASLRITAYMSGTDLSTFDFDKLRSDIHTMVMAQDILVDHSFYPTADIAECSYRVRNIGLNFGDLGKLLFKMGLPYDSDHGRFVASLLTAFVTLEAYKCSKNMAVDIGPYEAWSDSYSRQGMLRVLSQHLYCITDDGPEIQLSTPTLDMLLPNWLRSVYARDLKHGEVLLAQMREEWIALVRDIEVNGIRNSALTIFVPMGTVGLALGCDTTGLEPEFSHRRDKQLVGGGKISFKSDIDTSGMNLSLYQQLYDTTCQGNCLTCNHMERCKLMETALGTTYRTIDEFGTHESIGNVLPTISHIDMMAAVQPFISLGISKTVNAPAGITVEEIVQLYEHSYRSGLKAVTVYVDGSKVLQPLSVTGASKYRKKIVDPCERYIRGWSVTIAGEKLYIMFGWHPEYLDDVWEVWFRMSGIGGTTDGFAATIAIMASQDLQQGMRDGTYEEARAKLLKTMLKMSYPPNGLAIWNGSGVPSEFNDIRSVRSIPNLLGQMLASMRAYPGGGNRVARLPFDDIENRLYGRPAGLTKDENIIIVGEYCASCGRPMVKHGMSSSCYKCLRCGTSVGGCG